MGIMQSSKHDRKQGGRYSHHGNHSKKDSYVQKQTECPCFDRFLCLPNEIITNILSFLATEDLQRCCTVSHLFHEYVKSQSLWKIKCLRERVYIERYMRPFIPDDWKIFYLKRPFSRNLVKNSSGQDGFNHWTKTSDGGEGWIVEQHGAGSKVKPLELLTLADQNTCNFATSYGVCAKEQTIDLLREGFNEEMLDKLQPAIKVGDWYAARFDCGNTYSVEVTLLRDNKENDQSVVDTFSFGPLETKQGTLGHWMEISHTFRDYRSGLRLIKFSHRSKDSQFWAGHYGSKMAGSNVSVLFGTEQ